MVAKSLFVVGDSISVQYGPFLEQMVKGRYSYARKTGTEEALAKAELKTGNNGGDSGAVLAYLSAMRTHGNFQPDVLLLNCGLHDIKTDPATGRKQVSLDQYRQNLRKIVALFRGVPTRVIWVRTTPVDDKQHNDRKIGFHRFARDVTAYNSAADSIMGAAGLTILDLCGFTRNLGAGVFHDHVHYTEPVRAQQAAYIAGFLAGLELES